MNFGITVPDELSRCYLSHFSNIESNYSSERMDFQVIVLVAVVVAAFFLKIFFLSTVHKIQEIN